MTVRPRNRHRAPFMRPPRGLRFVVQPQTQVLVAVLLVKDWARLLGEQPWWTLRSLFSGSGRPCRRRCSLTGLPSHRPPVARRCCCPARSSCCATSTWRWLEDVARRIKPRNTSGSVHRQAETARSPVTRIAALTGVFEPRTRPLFAFDDARAVELFIADLDVLAPKNLVTPPKPSFPCQSTEGVEVPTSRATSACGCRPRLHLRTHGDRLSQCRRRGRRRTGHHRGGRGPDGHRLPGVADALGEEGGEGDDPKHHSDVQAHMISCTLRVLRYRLPTRVRGCQVGVARVWSSMCAGRGLSQLATVRVGGGGDGSPAPP